MNFRKFATLFLGIFFIGVSIGYTLGFYVQKYSYNNNLFYISAFIMGVGSFLLIYATLFSWNKKNDN